MPHRCSGTNRRGEPCSSPVVDPETRRCPAHSGRDMQALGATGGRRSGELRRERSKSLAQLLRERYLLEVDPLMEEIAEAFQRGDFDAVLAVVHRARGPQEYAQWLRWREEEEARMQRDDAIQDAVREYWARTARRRP